MQTFFNLDTMYHIGDISQCPLSKNVFPHCERTNHQLSINYPLEVLKTIDLKGSFATQEMQYPCIR